MTKQTEETLARSLTAESTELVPFLPYLLQDLWELGANPRDIVKLIKKHILSPKDQKILDLACGKGAVAIEIAKTLNIRVHGVDLVQDFIESFGQKTKSLNLSHLCTCECGDANEAVKVHKNYDCVIFAAAGNVLGNPRETFKKLCKTIKPGGYIIMDEGYLPDNASNNDVKYVNYEYMTKTQWLELFESCGLTLLEEVINNEDYDFDSDNKAIQQRANELIQKHPEKREIFEGYIASQLNECEDLESNILAATWLLKWR